MFLCSGPGEGIIVTQLDNGKRRVRAYILSECKHKNFRLSNPRQRSGGGSLIPGLRGIIRRTRILTGSWKMKSNAPYVVHREDKLLTKFIVSINWNPID